MNLLQDSDCCCSIPVLVGRARARANERKVVGVELKFFNELEICFHSVKNTDCQTACSCGYAKAFPTVQKIVFAYAKCQRLGVFLAASSIKLFEVMRESVRTDRIAVVE